MSSNQVSKLLDALPESVRLSLQEKSHALRFARGEQVLRQEDDSKDVFYINYGKVLVTFYTEKGDKLSFTEMGAGESFGEIAAIDTQPRSANIIALEETLLTHISQQKFLTLLRDYPDFSFYVMRRMTALIRRLHRRVHELSSLDGTHRIYAELLRLAEKGEPLNGHIVIHNPPTHTEIAARINSHREAVSRTFRALMREGLLDKGSKKLIVYEPDTLQKRIDLRLKSG